MNLSFKDRLKSIVLAVLILLSFIQVGILWGYQNHGFPINFLPAIFSLKETDLPLDRDKITDELFKPYDIIVSEGYIGERWFVEPDSEDFDRLWSAASAYLSDALATKPLETVPVGNLLQDTSGDTMWNDIVSKRGFIFEFKTNIPSPVLSWFLKNADAAPGAISGVHKLAIIPRDKDDINNNLLLYVMDDTSISKYSFSGDSQTGNGRSSKSRKLAQDDYLKLIEKYSSNSGLNTYRVWGEFHKGTNVRQDMLFNAKSGGYLELAGIICAPPDEFDLKNSENASERSDLAEVILGSEKFPYETYVANDGAVLFSSPNNTYRVYEDGYAEYSYKTPAQVEQDKGSMKDAFEKTLEFIYAHKRRQLASGVEIYLSGISEEKGVYRFSFDYRTLSYNIPVAVSYEASYEKKDKQKTELSNAITVEATGTRVLACRWLIRKFELASTERYINTNYDAIIDKISEENVFFRNNFINKGSGFIVLDVNPAYMLTREAGIQSRINPVWLVTTNLKSQNNRYLIVNMKK